MSQRNPMNDRYTSEKHTGSTRKSAASAKPKSKAAASVSYGSAKKTPKDRKAEQKAIRKEEAARQRELDRKYYKPDTPRYKRLRRIWWSTISGAAVCTAMSYVTRSMEPSWIAVVFLVLAYACIITAFYVDFGKVRKERRAYQTKMYALEIEQRKAEEREAKEAARKENASKAKRRH